MKTSSYPVRVNAQLDQGGEDPGDRLPTAAVDES
jgi:hypothetical protein